MYAIIKTGGKQYKVTPECVLDVEKLELEAGQVVKFEEVLAIGEEGGQLKVGTPKSKAPMLKQKSWNSSVAKKCGLSR